MHRGTFALDGGPWGDKPAIRTMVDERTGTVVRTVHPEGPYPTIDRVLWRGSPEGPPRFYSSKPPSTALLAAGLYWATLRLSDLADGSTSRGWRLLDFYDDATGDPRRRLAALESQAAGRTVLLVLNVLPLLAFLAVYRLRVLRTAPSPWIAVYAVAAAALGTYLTVYARTLNNHLPAGLAAFFAVVCLSPGPAGGTSPAFRAAAAGFLAGLTASLELPAILFPITLVLVLARRRRGREAAILAAAAVVPLAVLVLVNRLQGGMPLPAQVLITLQPERYSELYHHAGGYWDHKLGIDAASDPKPLYLFHMLLGHHGILALTPVLAFAAIGLATRHPGQPSLETLRRPLTILTLVMIAFYTLFTSNYGGVAQGFRWLLWLTPLWLLYLPAGLHRVLHARSGRLLALAALAVSIFSVLWGLVMPMGPWVPSWLDLFLGTPAAV